MSSDYTFNFTDISVTPISVPIYYVDGPVTPIVDTAIEHIVNQVYYPITTTSPSTTLVLVGRGVADYGQTIQQNMLYMLENFASSISPVHPVIGQLWYNKHTNVLNVYNYTGGWIPLISSTGGTVTGSITLTGAISNSTDVVNKLYVDNAINTIGVGQILTNYDALTGILTTQIGDPTNSTTAVIPPVSQLTVTALYDVSTETVTITLSNENQATVQITKPNIARTIIISAGEAMYTIPEYIIGNNRLWIFVNGIKQLIGDDYTETDSTTITFSTSQSIGAKIEFLYI